MQNITIKNNKVTNKNAFYNAYTKDAIATVNIVKNTKNTKQMCTNATVYKIMLNAQSAVAETTFENDCTASSYYCMLADNLASITTFYYANYENAYICVNKVMQCVTQHLTYYDDCRVAENLLANTVLADADINNYCYLSN
jgi:hypothetical protein